MIDRLFLIAVGSALVAAVGSIVIPLLCERDDFGAMIERLAKRLFSWRR